MCSDGLNTSPAISRAHSRPPSWGYRPTPRQARDNQPWPPDCARADYLQHGLQSGLYGIPTLYGLVQPFNSARAQRSFGLSSLSTTASGCWMMPPHSLAAALRAAAPLVSTRVRSLLPRHQPAALRYRSALRSPSLQCCALAPYPLGAKAPRGER